MGGALSKDDHYLLVPNLGHQPGPNSQDKVPTHSEPTEVQLNIHTLLPPPHLSIGTDPISRAGLGRKRRYCAEPIQSELPLFSPSFMPQSWSDPSLS